MKRFLAGLVVAASMTGSFAGVSHGGDWPQWRGPNRDDRSEETGLKKDFKAAPKTVWKITDAGIGYSGPSILDGKLYLVGGTPEGAKHQDEVSCYDANTGDKVWRVKLEGQYEDSGSDKNWGGGPRGNPTITKDGMVYVLGIRGDLFCLDAKDGKVVWTKSYAKDFGGKLMSGWGFSESPLVDGEKIVCIPGGSGGSIIALDRKTGKTIWRTKELKDDAAYASVVKAKLSGVEQYVTLTSKGVVGVDVESGKLLWKLDCGDKYRVAVIPTPVIAGENLVYATSGYGAGCDLIKISGDAKGQKAERVFANKDVVNHHGGVIYKDGHIYGHSDTKGWICQDLESGKLKWEAKGGKALDKGSVTYADGALYCFGERSGDLAVYEATPKGAKELGRFKLPEQTKIRRPSGMIWTHPVIANGKLYLRDQDLLFCFDIAGDKN
jgi:outer membrane protein assembly factor BamB